MIHVRAVISASMVAGFQPVDVYDLTDYYIESAMDNDADMWNITMAYDPRLVAIMQRDVEIKVSIYGVGKGVESLHTGFLDEATLSHEGILALSGRDITAPAADSILKPGIWKNVTPQSLIPQQGAELKMGARFRLIETRPLKQIASDGSETYWEFWTRFYRHVSRWMWAEPDGEIIADNLLYKNTPDYYFGTPRPGTNWAQWIPIETAEWTKKTSDRVGEVFVYGHTGKVGFVANASDPTTSHWIKRPRKIVQSRSAHSIAEARVEAWNEIFESKVGALEWRISVHNPGLIIRQNSVAQVHIPKIGLFGNFYVVGTRMVGGENGFAQEVRLRELNYSLSRRVPTDPILRQPGTNAKTQTELAKAGAPPELSGIRWWDYFTAATTQYHGLWPYPLFLAVLLAICQQESGFVNAIEGDLVHDYEPLHFNQKSKVRGGVVDAWHRKWANEIETTHTKEKGVGPMQLTTRSLKYEADEFHNRDYGSGRTHDEFNGDRWDPEANIMIAAKYFSEVLKGLDPTDDTQIWTGVQRYNAGIAGAAKGNGAGYRESVKKYFTDKFQQPVQAAFTKAQKAPEDVPDPTTDAPGTLPTEIQKLLEFARDQAQKKVPYDWGGGMPDVGMDCSGFVNQAYFYAGLGKAVGVSARGQHGPTTYGLWNDGKGMAGSEWMKVEKAHIWPGDMVFFEPDSQGPGHVTMAMSNTELVEEPSSHGAEPYCRMISLSEKSSRLPYVGALRLKSIWGGRTPGTAAPFDPSTMKKVMISAGHAYDVDRPAGAGESEPAAHRGETGAAGPSGRAEINYTPLVRDVVVKYLNADGHFKAERGDAWSASAGNNDSGAEPIDWSGDMFVCLHYDSIDGGTGSRFFFGWPRDRSDAREIAGSNLKDKIATEYEKISGHPTRNTDADQSNERLWGYYAWGSPEREATTKDPNALNQQDHIPTVPAAVLMEMGCGGTSSDGHSTVGADHNWLWSHIDDAGYAIYCGICEYYGYTPKAK